MSAASLGLDVTGGGECYFLLQWIDEPHCFTTVSMSHVQWPKSLSCLDKISPSVEDSIKFGTYPARVIKRG